MEICALWFSEGIGSPSVGAGSSVPFTTTVGGGAGVAGALVAAASVAAAFRPAKSGFQSSFTKSWNTAQENVPGWASTASLAVRPRIE